MIRYFLCLRLWFFLSQYFGLSLGSCPWCRSVFRVFLVHLSVVGGCLYYYYYYLFLLWYHTWYPFQVALYLSVFACSVLLSLGEEIYFVIIRCQWWWQVCWWVALLVFSGVGCLFLTLITLLTNWKSVLLSYLRSLAPGTRQLRGWPWQKGWQTSI